MNIFFNFLFCSFSTEGIFAAYVYWGLSEQQWLEKVKNPGNKGKVNFCLSSRFYNKEQRQDYISK